MIKQCLRDLSGIIRLIGPIEAYGSVEVGLCRVYCANQLRFEVFDFYKRRETELCLLIFHSRPFLAIPD